MSSWSSDQVLTSLLECNPHLLQMPKHSPSAVMNDPIAGHFTAGSDDDRLSSSGPTAGS